MDPVFKIICPGSPVSEARLTGGRSAVIFEMGERMIVFRAATGEHGSEGPFPYVELRTKVSEGQSKGTCFCLTRESQFEDLWKALEAGCR
uniref:Uncharacterized protein n=1 Tax=viral metagenome TaxID=1070528 RepID=A0A6M3MGD6_9ZZZZ